MYNLVIGQQFPFPDYLNRGEGGSTMIVGNFFDIVVCLDTPTDSEIRSFERKLTVNLYENKSIPFIVLDFEDFNCDSFINFWKIDQSNDDQWLNSEANAVTLFLIDSKTGILKAIRMLGLDPAICNKIRDTCEQQTQVFSGVDEVEEAAQDVLRSVSTDNMIKRAKLHQTFKP